MRIFTLTKPLPVRCFSVLLACAVALLPVTASRAANDDRVALVIGNDQYPTDPLRNAVNDAQAVAKTLSDLGFKVMIKTNADYATMRGVAVEFARVMEGATAAVFYYAGHGIQYRGQNYLVPTDAKLTSEASIAFNAMPVTQILDTIDEAKVRHKFIILDACRNNPFSNVFTSTGLAKIQAPAGTIVSFAAAAGQVAPDGA
ncbi:MAG: caspase family protein [Burkholderiales bacterium]|nr:caspase family protein [Burkholderiales bacterium]